MPGLGSSDGVRPNISLNVSALQNPALASQMHCRYKRPLLVATVPLAQGSNDFSVRPKTLLALTLSILAAIFMHAPAIHENNSVATQFKPSVDKFEVGLLNVSLPARSQELPNTSLFASMSVLSPAVMSISVGQEQHALVLLGLAFLLGGLIWLKKARRAEVRPAVNYKTAVPPVVLPKMEPQWIEVELVTEPASPEACNEAQISV